MSLAFMPFSSVPAHTGTGEFQRVSRFLLMSAVVAAAAATDPAWTSKAISEWTSEDARRVLTDSPWVKHAAAALVPLRGEAQLRDGGRMGAGGKRVGLDAANRSSGAVSARQEMFETRWESAMPVRAAEIKAGETGSPSWEGDYYAIAIYDVPGITPRDQKYLPSELKQYTSLKRDGKKDVRPVQVDVSLFDNRLARILYLFPRSANINAEDQGVRLVAQIGRLHIEQVFVVEEMRYRGKLEL